MSRKRLRAGQVNRPNPATDFDPIRVVRFQPCLPGLDRAKRAAGCEVSNALLGDALWQCGGVDRCRGRRPDMRLDTRSIAVEVLVRCQSAGDRRRHLDRSRDAVGRIPGPGGRGGHHLVSKLQRSGRLRPGTGTSFPFTFKKTACTQSERPTGRPWTKNCGAAG